MQLVHALGLEFEHDAQGNLQAGAQTVVPLYVMRFKPALQDVHPKGVQVEQLAYGHCVQVKLAALM